MIDKMIEELEELKWQAEKDMQLSESVEEANYYGGLNDAYEKSIVISEKYKADKCKWIHYDYRTICPKEHDVDNPYWRIPENMNKLKYCPYCGKEIEVDE